MTWIAPGVERSEDYPARRNGPEREMLRDWLDWHRATLLHKCAGLDATRLATRAVPPSSLSLLGLVRHMSDTERGWVRQTYRGEQVPDLYYRSDAPDADFEEADPAGAEEDFERYRAECLAVDAALEGAKLDDTFLFREKTTSVRWMWQHLVEELLHGLLLPQPAIAAPADEDRISALDGHRLSMRLIPPCLDASEPEALLPGGDEGGPGHVAGRQHHLLLYPAHRQDAAAAARRRS